jgi:hypothetical protein
VCIDEGAENVRLHKLICYVGSTSHRSRPVRIISVGTLLRLCGGITGSIYRHLLPHQVTLSFCSESKGSNLHDLPSSCRFGFVKYPEKCTFFSTHSTIS